MSKAYDRVEWRFLTRMTEKMGFSDIWFNKIHDCIYSVSFSFNLNREVCGSVKPSRGLRQGDPLSPYLFLVCAEGLSCLLHQAVANKTMIGFQCNKTMIAEAYAILRGIRFAVDAVLLPAVIESDAKTVVDLIDAKAPPLADIGVVISDIINLCKH
ncbi:hypothetical protein Dsin_030946 [Dipteronia sinensis]|uniref:Reverse transcriptase n=1 Tax=Dipteronia sinensis TaxID=43782 RepID=A0AAD9ZLK5_9ROSI|nr:hypothetical protein Dsin_030946 [Dipteronia sinensis]